MEILTRAEFEAQLKETLRFEQVDYNCQGFDEVSRSFSKWTDDRFSQTKFASGIKLILSDEAACQNHSYKNEHNDLQILVSKFYLSGQHGVVSPGIPNVEAEYLEQAGQNYLFYLPDIKETEQFFTGSPLQIVKINLDLKFLRSFVTDLDEVPQQLQPLIEGDNAPTFHRSVGKVTPRMRSLIKQMWQHPYQGAIARMYLEAKALELLAMQFAQLAKSDFYTARSALTDKKIDPIYEARNILCDRLENSPSILELAQLVGVSARTLRNGFRKVFGTTVIGYLNQQRMQQAEMMLRMGDYSVAEVANLVGYSHLGHFAAAFKRQFGITPSECLAGKLGRQ